ncbi:MAG TPA: hypothetical protein VFR87_19800 [Nocardioidaceae bacterium]|nr:hypothetical protein [Nocardioidaceae bacterium]
MSVLRPTHDARRDLTIAWVATGVVVGLIALMPVMPSVFEAVGLDLEGASFLAALGVLAVFVMVVDAFAVTAVVLGRRAARAGRFAGRVAMVVSATVAGFITFLMLASAVGHLLGME